MLLFNSCGLRQESESYENVLLETWNLAEIKCYVPDYSSGLRQEKYIIPITVTVEMKFTPRAFSYAVTETDNPVENCITVASGGYRVSYTSAKEGSLRYKDLSVSNGCDIDLNEANGGDPVTIPFGLSALEDDAEALYWTIDSIGQLILSVSTGFQGSELACAEQCLCYGFFDKKTN